MCSRSHEPLRYSIASYQPIPYNKKGEIYWTYINLCEDIGEVEQVDIINSAAKLMDHELYPLRHKYTPDIDKAYFKFCFVGKDGYATNHTKNIRIKSPFNFQDPLNEDVIAVMYPKYDGHYSGWGFFNDTKFFTHVEDGEGILLINSIVHEWFHGLGIGHSDKEEDIMFWQYGSDRRVTDDTRDGLDELYMDQRIKMIMKVPSSRRLVNELRKRSLMATPGPCDIIKSFFR